MKISHCEGCDRGYHIDSPTCPWCGTPQFMSYTHDAPLRACDTECYPNYWLCMFKDVVGVTHSFQMFPGHPLDREGLTRLISLSTLITFNGNHYDLPMIAYALAGADNAQLKAASDAIIQQNLQPWEFYKAFGLNQQYWIDCIDLIEVMPGRASLKIYGGKMHSRKIQDLPIEPHHLIDLFGRTILRDYCENDLDTTWDSYKMFETQVKLREQMSAEYGLDLRSKSDAQIAEAIMKKLLGGKVERVEVPIGTQFYYRPPAWLKFQNLKLLELLARSPFTVTRSGGAEGTPELDKTHIKIGSTTYKMGVGGLHSQESGATHSTDDHMFTLQDVDVASYYPTLILVTGINPPAIGARFQEIYRSWYERRLKAKHAGDKKTADSLKTVLNGTFGKLGSIWSIFYAPSEFIQVTITGQLALLMLIEMLELSGVSVVSGNTDGIVIRCPIGREWVRDAVVEWWRQTTGFETEAVEYRAICSRDVNNYVAVKKDGKTKNKGAYAHPVPVATSWPNPTGEVCIDAIEAYLTRGTPIPDTVRACADVRKFVHLRAVKGGGMWNGEFLGKAVRWYYSSAPDAAEIVYKTNGNKVATSDKCRPIMELPEDYSVPADLDYDRYIADARAALADLGVQG